MREHIQHTAYRRIRGLRPRSFAKVTALQLEYTTVNTRTLNPRAQVSPIPRRGGFTTNICGTAPKTPRTPAHPEPKVHTLSHIQPPCAAPKRPPPALISMPVSMAVHHRSGMQGKPPTPQYRSHSERGATSTHPLTALRIHRLSNLRVCLEEFAGADAVSGHSAPAESDAPKDNLLITPTRATGSRSRFTDSTASSAFLPAASPILTANRTHQLLERSTKRAISSPAAGSSHRIFFSSPRRFRNVIGSGPRAESAHAAPE